MKKNATVIMFAAGLLAAVGGCENASPDTHDDILRPVLNVPDTLTVPSEGGESVLTYTVSNPVDGAVVTAATGQLCDWISGINSDNAGSVTFGVVANPEDEPRYAEMNVVYFYGQGDTVSRTTVIAQAPKEVTYDYTVEGGYFYGVYRGLVNGLHRYMLYISDKPFSDGGVAQPLSFLYIFGVYSEAPLDSGNPRPVDGEYEFELHGGLAPHTFMFDGNASWWYSKDADGFFDLFGEYREGTLTISSDGDSVMYDAKIKDDLDALHHVSAVSAEPYVISEE